MNKLDTILKQIGLLENKSTLTEEETKELENLYKQEEQEYERKDRFIRFNKQSKGKLI